MSKYFKELWSETNKNKKGLPRPYAIIPTNFVPKITMKLRNNFYLHSKIPIPWQSAPLFSQRGGTLQLDINNESLAVTEGLCGYCGIGFTQDDQFVRWAHKNDLMQDRVGTDYLPLHPACMKQARIFCPFMRQVPKEDFVYGKYATVLPEAVLAVKKIDKEQVREFTWNTSSSQT
jgi:hypothetical protein